MRRHRRPTATRWVFALVLICALRPAAALPFSTIPIPGAGAPKLLHVEGTLLAEPPARGRFLSVRIDGVTRYLTVDQLRLLGSSETDLAVFERLKPKSPNLDLRPLDAKQDPKLSDPQLLGKDVVLEGYVHLDDRSPMIVTKLEPRAS